MSYGGALKAVLSRAKHCQGMVRQKLTNAVKMMNSHLSRTQELVQERDDLKKALQSKEMEISILNDSMKKEKAYFIALKEEEVAEYQKRLDSVKRELEKEKRKNYPIQVELQSLMRQLEQKSEEVRTLEHAREEINLQLNLEKEKVEMKVKELKAAAESHTNHMREVELQLQSLKETEKQKAKEARHFQKTLCQKETEIQRLSHQISAKEDEVGRLTHELDEAKLHQKEKMLLELADMKSQIMALKDELQCERTKVKLAQDETSYYQECSASLQRATRGPIKLRLKWSDRERAPEEIVRGAAVAECTTNTVYIMGCDSHTIYKFHVDADKWSEHCQCPHTNPGLAIISHLLTAVGGNEGENSTNKLVSWNGRKWVQEFPPMQSPRQLPALVHYGTYIIALGGDHEQRGVEVLNIRFLTWSTAVSLPISLHYIVATLCNDDIIAMARHGMTYKINIHSLISTLSLEASTTGYIQWVPIPECPVGYPDVFGVYGGWPALTTFHEETVVVHYYGIYQLHKGQWEKIGDMPHPKCYCLVCTVRDQMVVVGGSPDLLSVVCSDAVCVGNV